MNAVSVKRILHETMQEKLKQSWVSNFAKKIKKKTNSSSANKEAFWTPHPHKTCGVRLCEVLTPLFVHLWTENKEQRTKRRECRLILVSKILLWGIVSVFNKGQFPC